jgi:hypothetical protein
MLQTRHDNIAAWSDLETMSTLEMTLWSSRHLATQNTPSFRCVRCLMVREERSIFAAVCHQGNAHEALPKHERYDRSLLCSAGVQGPLLVQQ